jgi:uncharacterized protein YggT (Ycf19 family)
MKTRAIDFTGLIINVVNFITGLIVLGLLIRFLFRLLGANPGSGIVEFIYISTSPLLDPFRGIFPTDVIDPNNVLEYSSLIAIIFYLLFAWIVVVLIGMFRDYIDSRDKEG